MISVKKVAEWFLSQRSMEHKVLQKLCYYAQAWHCALEGQALFSEHVNLDTVTCFYKEPGKQTVIAFTSGHSIEVAETPEQFISTL